MNKNMTVSLVVFGILIVAILVWVFWFANEGNANIAQTVNNTSISQANSTVFGNYRINLTMVGPPTIVYKTRGIYYNLVPVYLSNNGTSVTGYPDVKDVLVNGEFPYPTRLDNGYLLDNRGLSADSAFLNITYEEYSKLPKTPTSTELYNMIIDKNPFTEIYYCGSEYQFGNNLVGSLNAIIDSGQLSECENLLTVKNNSGISTVNNSMLNNTIFMKSGIYLVHNGDSFDLAGTSRGIIISVTLGDKASSPYVSFYNNSTSDELNLQVSENGTFGKSGQNAVYIKVNSINLSSRSANVTFISMPL